MPSGDPAGDPADRLQAMLRDVMNVVAGSAGASGWIDAARSLAQGVATEGEAEDNADPLDRIRLQELARVAELHVSEATGLPVGGDHPVAPVAVGRGAWAALALEAYRPWLDGLVARPQPGAGLDPAAGLDLDGPAAFTDMFARFSVTFQPLFLGMQFGSAVGHLARRAMGPYALPLPWPGVGELPMVPANIARFATDWSLPTDETELWVCIHELTAHAVLSRPHVVTAVNDLLVKVADETVRLQDGLADRLVGEGDADSLQQLLSDPDSLLADLLTPEHRYTSDRLTALAAVLGGYVDHVTARVAGTLIGTPAALTEAWHRYRVADADDERAAAALFGIDLTRAQVDRGAAFVSGVVDRAGEDGLVQLWTVARNLPTPAEVDAPGLWLERIDLPVDEVGPGEEEDSGQPPG